MDVLNIRILEDGTIRTETVGHVTPANHQSAEAFLADVARQTGGQVTRNKRPNSAHSHHHTHVGQGQDHDH